MLRLSRMFRILKFGRHGEVIQLVVRALKRSMSAFMMFLMLIAMAMLIFGTLVWFAEKGEWLPANHPALLKLNIHDRDAYLRTWACTTSSPSGARVLSCRSSTHF